MKRGPRLSIQRERRGKGFTYLRDGLPVDEATVRRIEKLAIPPAWDDVEIAASRSAKVLARGIDAAGRTQYIYHPRFRAQQDEAKFERLADFARQLPMVREQLGSDLRRHGLGHDRVIACVLTLIDQELFRVGSQRYTEEHNTYGVTTLTTSHLTLTASRARLRFPGKSGSRFERTISDSRVVRVLTQLAELPGGALFQYCDDETEGKVHPVTADHVNASLKGLVGDEHSAKDFRTWGGTVQVVRSLLETHDGEETDVDARTRAAIQSAAECLENTPEVARSAYVAPAVITAFTDTATADALRADFERLTDEPHFSREEQFTLHILEGE